MKTEEEKGRPFSKRELGILVDKFHYMADDFNETPDCFDQVHMKILIEKYKRYESCDHNIFTLRAPWAHSLKRKLHETLEIIHMDDEYFERLRIFANSDIKRILRRLKGYNKINCNVCGK